MPLPTLAANKPLRAAYHTEVYPDFNAAILSEGDSGVYFPGVYWGGYAQELLAETAVTASAPGAWLTTIECNAPGFQGCFRALFVTTNIHRFDGAFHLFAYMTPEAFRRFTTSATAAPTQTFLLIA
jgi:hypothetical protein